MKEKTGKQNISLRAGWQTPATEDVMMVQETMRVMGLYDGPIDGLAGSATFRAVRQYKKSIHLAPDNSLNSDFIEHLRNET